MGVRVAVKAVRACGVGAIARPPPARSPSIHPSIHHSRQPACLLKKEPRAVNMRVEVKEVATPSAATPAKAAGASPSAEAPAGKRCTA